MTHIEVFFRFLRDLISLLLSIHAIENIFFKLNSVLFRTTYLLTCIEIILHLSYS